MSNVIVIRCCNGAKTLEVMLAERYLERLRESSYDSTLPILTGTSGPVDLNSFNGEILIEGDLVVPRPHPELAAR